jgi:nucleoside-diphosphate-sugar epimerase
MSETLVIGGNGFLGRHLVPALQDRGDSVRVLALPTEDTGWLEGRGVMVHGGDIRQPDTLVAPMRGVDRVVHLAGMMGVWRPMEDYRAVNVTGTKNVCRAVLATGARLLHVSSWTVYGMGLGKTVGEDCALRPLPEPYALTKAAGDKAVQRMIAEDHLPAVIIRPGTIFGPGDRLNFGRTADRLRAGRQVIVGRGNNAVPFVYVTDVVQGLMLALENDRAVGHAYNITTDRPLTQQQLLNAIAHEIGTNAPRLHVPYHALYAASCAAERLSMLTRSQRDPLVTRHGVALFGTDNRHAIDRARQELGYTPQVEVCKGVRLAARWYRQLDRSGLTETPAVGHAAEGIAV